MVEARYDAIAGFYVAGWSDACDEPATAALLDAAANVNDLAVVDLACGHGRVTRALARRGARVLGVDISRTLLAVAAEMERSNPLGVEYRCADLTSDVFADRPARFDIAVCNFGLSDIDDLDAALTAVSAGLRSGGRFVVSLLHPCFPGADDVSGSWPAGQSYSVEGRWTADGAQSTLRRQVGATHRTLSTYFNSLVAHGLRVDLVVEPEPASEWAASRARASRLPVFLVLSATKI